MSILQKVKSTIGAVSPKSGPRILSVKKAWHLTPNMIRVTFSGSELEGFPIGREGGNCKLLIPNVGENKESFVARIKSGPAPTRRTYTVRAYRPDTNELDIDFVDHGDTGPASGWACRAEAGDFIGFMGPSTPKVTSFDADWYLVAADPSAIPVAAATLEAMPKDAKGIALFEVTSLEDRQELIAPEGVEVHWIEHGHPHVSSTKQEDFIRSLDWPRGKVQTCIAGESGVIRSLRAFLHQEMNIPRSDTYISGYWKIGLVEDEHQQMKRSMS